MTAPTWITPAGFLGTVTERTPVTLSVSASGNNVTYSIISGALPGGLRFTNTGTISGTPYSVGEVIKNQFVVRAASDNEITDRTFYLNTDGPSSPNWLTPSGFLPVGFSSQLYSINRQYVDYQLNAEYDKLPAGQKLRYFIEDGDGSLPPGVDLTEDGRLVGQIVDKLTLSYRASSTGGYDKEVYDVYPFDHVTMTASSAPTSAKYIAKIYQFYVTASDSVASAKQLFKIKVEDPASLRVDNTYISIDTEQYLSDAGFLLSPQWLTSANLGVVRANNNQVIKLNIYDFNPGSGSVRYDWVTPTVNDDGTPSIHPPNFKLEPTTGALYATIPYQPAWSISYKFTIWAIKKDYQTLEETLTARTFTLIVRGDVETTIEWVSDSNIGSLIPGYISELSVKAQHIGAPYTIEYQLIDGVLPAGLTLLQDGSIAGQITYNSLFRIDNNTTIFDGGTSTFDKKYTFTVKASDIYQTSAITKDFYITVVESNLTKYTKIFVQPFLTSEQRSDYTTFITNPYTFDRSLMYRLDDPSFGIQKKIQLYLEHGIEQINLDYYTPALRQYFYRKRFLFGEVKWIKANDSAGNYVYDLVYVDIIDPLDSISGPVTFSGTTVYPNSIVNMKNMLESITLKGVPVLTDEYLMPRFMRTIQSDTGSPLGFIMAVPLCYALPGKGDTIVKRIKVADFDFKSIDFDVDRLVVKDNLTVDGAKYLLFPRRDITGTNLGAIISQITGPEGFTIDTEDGVPLQVEI